MKWEGNRSSDNVEDRRSSGSSGGFTGGRRIGIGTIVIALLGGWALGVNPLTILGLLSGQGGGAGGYEQQQGPAQRPPADDRMAQFVSTVLADTENVWTPLFAQQGMTYQKPKLVLFRGATATACGQGQSAMGPFYCPADQKVYIDLAFYETLQKRLGAPGDFAQAYVIAHEVGHHVQKLLGTSDKVHQLRSRQSEAQANAASVRLELQADCYAGLWAHHANNARQVLEQGDIEEAMHAAQQIGDDALQRGSGQVVMPESFTHGSSAQRQKWFATGYKTGSLQACDTFSSRSL